ncbi:uncharacterized protein LOC142789992 [Rhipicephalus microplus]|uniref:uncharacterized protein LOC142789992 n=1 Tax=Rhipicephalus microplus TaxID=6941 RepID=UPI003F6B3474
MTGFLLTCFLIAGSLTGAQGQIRGRIDGKGFRGHWSAGIADVGPRGAPGVSAVFRASFGGSFSSDTEDEPTSSGFGYGRTRSAGRPPAKIYSRYLEHEPWRRYGDYGSSGNEVDGHPLYSEHKAPWAGGYENDYGHMGYGPYPYAMGNGYSERLSLGKPRWR